MIVLIFLILTVEFILELGARIRLWRRFDVIVSMILTIVVNVNHNC